MIEQEFLITNPTGLHTRPANRFVKEAKKFECDINIKKNHKHANGKSLLKILKMGISQGDIITLTFNGSDEKAALDDLSLFMKSLEE